MLHLSPWWPANEHDPVHNGTYEVMFYDGEKCMMPFRGCWTIPRTFIKCWRGICG